MTVELVWDGKSLLGEGPFWDARRGVLWFVDIKGRAVHRYNPDTGSVDRWAAPTDVGWVLPADDGALLAGLRSGLARFDPVREDFEEVVAVERSLPRNRLNDATVSPDGAVWFGTMDDDEKRPTGRFYRWDGKAVTVPSIGPMVVSNGPAIDPDARRLYFSDTMARTILCADLDSAGRTGRVRDFARIADNDGFPDGLIVDSAGNVWVGLWSGWRARKYSPDGVVVDEIEFPVANVTKIALGGRDLTVAYATTARIGVEGDAQPFAGGLFRFDVDTPGRELPYALSAEAPETFDA